MKPIRRYAVVVDGGVVNVIEAPVGFALPGRTLIESDTADIGDLWDAVLEVFVKPALPFDIASRVAGNGLARQNRVFNRDLQADPLRALARRAGARRRSIAKL
jgi:hypothetical protein